MQPPHNEGGEREYALFFRVEKLHNLFGIPHVKFVSSPHMSIYSVIYLHQYDLRGVYFVLWVINQYYFVYFVA